MSDTIKLHGTKSGVISVTKLDEPYGKGSGTVASIAIALKGDPSEMDWKVHIPMENLDDVIKELQSLKS